MLTLTKISGNGFRPSVFGTSVDDHRIFYLGETTAYDWQVRAKNAVARFEALQARAQGIPLASERDPVLAWIGPAGSSDTPMERYLSVAEDISFSSQGENMDHYAIARVQNRVVKLENYNTELEAKVRVGELATGITSPPAGTTIPTGTKTTIAPVAAKTDWTLPLLIGGGAIAIAVVITLVAKKK